MAKPIIDIAVGVKSIDDMKYYTERLKDIGVIFRGEVIAGQMLFVKGDFEKDTRSHHIHVVEYNSKAWRDYVNFRDYLNTFSEKAKKYESIKIKLANMYPLDRKNYTEGKESLIHELLTEANLWKQDIDLMTQKGKLSVCKVIVRNMKLEFMQAEFCDADTIIKMNKELIDKYEYTDKIDYNYVMYWVRKNVEENIKEYMRIVYEGQIAGFVYYHPSGNKMELDDCFYIPSFKNKEQEQR